MRSCEVLFKLYEVVLDRKLNPRTDSYTSRLMLGGLNAISKKLGEELAELILSASSGSRGEVIHEAADLLYHLVVLLAYRDIHLSEVLEELKRRFK